MLFGRKSGKNPLDIAGLLKIKGSEIQQRYAELMMLAAGPYSLPLIEEASTPAGRAISPVASSAMRPWRGPTSTSARPPFTVALQRKCNATSSRRPCWADAARATASRPFGRGSRSSFAGRCGANPPPSQQETGMDFDSSDDQQQLRDAARRWVDKAYTFEHRRAAGGRRRLRARRLGRPGRPGPDRPHRARGPWWRGPWVPRTPWW